MKKIIILGCILTGLQLLSAQTPNKNYMVTTIPYQEVTNLTTLTDANSNTAIQYFDGLGRPTQKVQRGISNNSADWITGIMYDSFGRDSLQWLPAVAVGNNGAYYPNFAAQAIINNGDAKPYNHIEYESSPLNRVTGKYGAGNEWYYADKKTKIEEDVNTTYVRYFHIMDTQLYCELFNARELYLKKTIDEDGKTVEEYSDKLGRKVLVRIDGDHDTFYVYDDYNNLCYVIPPMATDCALGPVDISTNSSIDLYGYIYKYDSKQRCIEKKLPGCKPIYMVYDKADRLILSQDGNQRAKTPAQWTVTKYDVFNRIVYTGLLNSNDSRETLAGLYANALFTDSYTGSGPVAGYTSANLTPASLLSVNYYDSYSFKSLLPAATQTTINYEILSGYDKAYPITATTTDQLNAKGLLTGTRTYILDGSGNYNIAAIYYDDKGQVVQSRSTNHLGGYDLAFNVYRFSGVVEKTLKKHKISTSNELTELYIYDYNKAQQPTTTTYSLNGGSPVTLASNTYDDLGRLQTKKRHTNADTESYAYNVRSWPTNITSGGFIEKLYYNTNPINANLSFNGNISYSTWTYNNGSTVEKAYSYQYDGLNRLKTAEFKQGTSTQGSGSFDETFTYDKMGNILSLQRKKNYTTIDNLSFYYNGNQINYISDVGGSQSSYDIKEYQNKSTATSGEMAYDANGNMIKDLDRNIVDIRYNILNLPDTISFSNGNLIVNRYNAGGQKLSSRYLTNTTRVVTPLLMTPNNQVVSSSRLNATELNGETLTARDGFRPPTTPPEQEYPIEQEMPLYRGNETNYIGNYEYDSNVVVYTSEMFRQSYNLARIFNPEGYVTTVTNPQYHYYRRDHLGNNREVWLANTNTTVQRTQYYPSGLPWAEGIGAGVQNKKYNGKEFVEMHGYDTYDYGARGMYAAIGRWTAIDPLAEKYYSMSPYVYCGGNPVNRIDPDGMDWYQDDKGNAIWREGDAKNITIKDIAYNNIGATYTEQVDEHTSITYTQNKATSMTETVLDTEDFSSQMKSDGSGKKDGEDGNCFVQSGRMVKKSGAKSEDSPKDGIYDTQKELEYISSQANQGYSTRVQVDRTGDRKGDHWVAVSSVTTNLETNSVSAVGFFDPATRFSNKGTNNSFNVGNNKSLTGNPSYNPNLTYQVVQVRKNKK